MAVGGHLAEEGQEVVCVAKEFRRRGGGRGGGVVIRATFEASHFGGLPAVGVDVQGDG